MVPELWRQLRTHFLFYPHPFSCCMLYYCYLSWSSVQTRSLRRIGNWWFLLRGICSLRNKKTTFLASRDECREMSGCLSLRLIIDTPHFLYPLGHLTYWPAHDFDFRLHPTVHWHLWLLLLLFFLTPFFVSLIKLPPPPSSYGCYSSFSGFFECFVPLLLLLLCSCKASNTYMFPNSCIYTLPSLSKVSSSSLALGGTNAGCQYFSSGWIAYLGFLYQYERVPLLLFLIWISPYLSFLYFEYARLQMACFKWYSTICLKCILILHLQVRLCLKLLDLDALCILPFYHFLFQSSLNTSI